jgi:UDP-2,3-diacylglucosamine pyrophosphatase LpxH
VATELAITISDLHMGRGTKQDDFRGVQQFERFCTSIAEHAAAAGKNLTLVLNGDIIDLWEIVTDDELEMDGNAAILDGLCYPAVTPAEQDRARQRGKDQIDMCIAAHPEFARGIATVLATAPNAQIHYLVGNHDHGMIEPALQKHLLQRLTEASGSPVPENRFRFGLSLNKPEVRSYFEHGNQFSGNDSGFPNVLDPFHEAPGFYFLRFVWNRLQAQFGMSDNFGEIVRFVLLKIFNPGAPIVTSGLGFLYEYFEAHRTGRVPQLVHGPVKVIPKLYKKWLKEQAPREPGTKADGILKDEVEKTKDEPFKMKKLPGKQLMGHANPGSEAPELPGEAVHVSHDPDLRDEYWVGLRDRFKREVAPFPRLHDQLATVFLGHTHGERIMVLRSEIGDPTTTRYINSGSWTRPGRLVYGWADNNPDTFHARGAKVFG